MTYWRKTALWGAILLLLFELVVRYFVYSAPSQVQDPLWSAVPADGSCVFRGTEGFGITCYSLHGEIRTPFDDGRSVVVLGDSFTAATQVGDDGNYVSIAETLLRDSGRPLNLHNLGDPGRTPADYVYLAPAVMSTYDPELVIIQSSVIGFVSSTQANRENHFSFDADGRLNLVHENTTQTEFHLRNIAYRSALVTYFAYRLKNLDVGGGEARESASPAEMMPETQVAAIAQSIVDSYPHTQVIFLIIPKVPQVSEDEMTWTETNDESLLRALSTVPGLEVIYPSDAFRDLYEGSLVFPRGFFNSVPNYGHLNQHGHRAVAETLVEALVSFLKLTDE